MALLRTATSGFLATLLACEALVGGDEFAGQRGGQGFGHEHRPDGRSRLVQSRSAPQARDLLLDVSAQAVAVQQLLVGIRGRRETWRHPHIDACQARDHLPQ
ncbi:hypothetical protein AMK22_11940 [Streptomyces sp. CB01580]|nr:hypothetical protein AMK22_11940 [Streptomyces sp. CB01580]